MSTTTMYESIRRPDGIGGRIQEAARYASVDALRGLIMMIMAIDHASAFVARQHASEFWAGAMSAYEGAFPFLTRWLTHLCAPGFFFLMGAGIYWSGSKDASPATRRILSRGLVLFLMGQFLETPVVFLQSFLKPPSVSLSHVAAPIPSDGSAPYWGWVVLTCLGLTMMVCGVLLRLRPWAWLAVSAACVIATNSMLPASGKAEAMWSTVILVPGIAQHLLVMYPLIPWLALASGGMFFGHWWRTQSTEERLRVWLPGAILLVVGLTLRSVGGWGNIRLPRDSSWIEFLNNVKYPPSLVFWSISLGIDLLILALLMRLPEWIRSQKSPLMVFGQTPLFFYLAHFYLLALCGLTLFREAGSLEIAYVVWAGVLVALYPLCRWYRGFKMAKPRESLWRLF